MSMTSESVDRLRRAFDTASAPQEVTLVRPHRSKAEAFGAGVGYYLELFLTAWLLMLVVPFAVRHGFHPSYWQTFAGLWVLRATQTPFQMFEGRYFADAKKRGKR